MKVFGQEVIDKKFSLKKLEIGQCVTDRSLKESAGKMTRGKEMRQVLTPSGRRLDEGIIRTTHYTFQRVNRFVWIYKGECFLGETVERGMTFDELAEIRKKEREERKAAREAAKKK